MGEGSLLAALFYDLRECGENPLAYGQETHGELHLAALKELERLRGSLQHIAQLDNQEIAQRIADRTLYEEEA